MRRNDAPTLGETYPGLHGSVYSSRCGNRCYIRTVGGDLDTLANDIGRGRSRCAKRFDRRSAVEILTDTETNCRRAIEKKAVQCLEIVAAQGVVIACKQRLDLFDYARVVELEIGLR